MPRQYYPRPEPIYSTFRPSIVAAAISTGLALLASTYLLYLDADNPSHVTARTNTQQKTIHPSNLEHTVHNFYIRSK